jgi:small-conductance mechanosensitive channel
MNSPLERMAVAPLMPLSFNTRSLGIDELSHSGMLVRVWLKTAPMQQWRVGREFRLRVRHAFEANNIQVGSL